MSKPRFTAFQALVESSGATVLYAMDQYGAVWYAYPNGNGSSAQKWQVVTAAPGAEATGRPKTSVELMAELREASEREARDCGGRPRGAGADATSGNTL